MYLKIIKTTVHTQKTYQNLLESKDFYFVELYILNFKTGKLLQKNKIVTAI